MRRRPKSSNWSRSEGKLSSSKSTVVENKKRQGNYIPPGLNAGLSTKKVLKKAKKKQS